MHGLGLNPHFNLREARDKFDLDHGADGPPITIDGYLFFPDGAMRTSMEFHQPPEDPYERARMGVRYHEAVVRRWTEAFNEKKRSINSHTQASLRSGYPGPTDADVEELKKLQQTVFDCRQALERAQELVDQLKPDDQRREERMTAFIRSSAEAVRSQADNIQI